MNDDAAAAHFEKARSKLRAARVLLEANEAEDCGERRSPRFSPHFPIELVFPAFRCKQRSRTFTP